MAAHELIILNSGRTRVTIAPEFGGRIAQIEIFDGASWLPLLYAPEDVPPEQRDPLSWGSFVMAPWPNRITYGVFAFDGATYRLPGNDAGGHAIHGVAFDRPWVVERASDHGCELSRELDDRWPWRGRVSQLVELFDDGLRQTIEIASSGGRFPAGCGWHPWFRRDVRGARARALVDADERYQLAFDLIPNGLTSPVEGPHDLRNFSELRDSWLDDCYRDVRTPMRIAWGHVELTMTSSANVTHAVVYTPEHAVCIEPQTCAIDAFNLDARGIEAGTAVVGERRPLVAWTEWRWRISAAPLAGSDSPPSADS